MPRTIPIDDWLTVLEQEYLSTYIKDGGASVKFAVAPDAVRHRLLEEAEERCRNRNFLVLRLNAATVRAHMAHEIFFKLAQQIDWLYLARRVVLRLAEEGGYQVDRIDPRAFASVIDAVANENGLESQFVLADMRQAIQDRVSNSPEMLRDFRQAMRHLCLAKDDYPAHPLVTWLKGGSRVSSVREFSIHTRIDRTTARHFIESTLSWVRLAGYSGTVVLLDNARVTVARNPKDGFQYYTKAMTVDHYELLREFVDDIDRLAGMLMLVASDEAFLADGRGSRGFSIYEALKTRVMDDVRDVNLANPVASLVRLT